MTDALFYILIFVMAAVVIVLTIGIGGFGKGGAFNKKYANKMMRLRIIFQALAVVLILSIVALGGVR